MMSSATPLRPPSSSDLGLELLERSAGPTGNVGMVDPRRGTVLPPSPSGPSESAASRRWEEPDDTLAWLDQKLAEDVEVNLDDLDDDFGVTPVMSGGPTDTAIVTKVR